MPSLVIGELLGSLMLTFPKLITGRAALLLPLLLIFIFCQTPRSVASDVLTGHDIKQTIRPKTTAGLQAFFQTLDYDWQQLESGVPPLILEKFPTDIENAVNTAARKRAFFMGLLPMVLLANQEIEKEREEILQILQRHQKRVEREGDRERLEELSKRYNLRGRPIIDHRARTRLLRRVNIIPPSLVLAQAANESAWGTSRFAQLGNNIFGEWTFKPGTGIVPEGRPPGETYEVRKFSSIYESVRGYMNNLNRNGAYRKLREIREELNTSNQPVTGIALADGLLNYSQRGVEYVREIQAMIRQNKLAKVNESFLRQPGRTALTSLNSSGSGLLSSRNRMIGKLSSTRKNP